MSEADKAVAARPRLWQVAAGLITALALTILLWPAKAGPPEIEGAILAKPLALPDFTLRNHRGEEVDKSDLQSRWQLVSYGFTHCPDICPTLLAELAKFQQLLDSQSRFNDLQVLFYSVDPERDSIAQLAGYVPWFDPRFVGLRADTPAQAAEFEQGLGLRAYIQDDGESDNYLVAHGIRLYLLDDQARLRASLAPLSERDGSQHFEAASLLRDYLALRRWFAGQG